MIGAALIDTAVRNGVEVYAIVRPDTKRLERLSKSPLVKVVYSNLDSLSHIESLPDDCDALFHFAWVGTKKEDRNDPATQEKNIKYTLDAIELAKNTGCRRFVGAGSQAEYGPVEGIIDDSTLFNPDTSYGIAKLAAGILSRKKCESEGINHIWGRIFSVYGTRDNEGTMINYALDCWKKGETANFSSGEQYWNYLYESDAGEIFYRLGDNCLESGTYFVANTESRPLKEYLQSLIAEYGEGAEAIFASSNIKHPGLNVDSSKTMNTINYRPQVSFEEGIKKVISYKESAQKM